MKSTGAIDLHTHTTASDGSLTPFELVREAARVGLSALAITDHDTVDGLPEAIQAAKGLDLEVIPGVEISVDAGFQGGVHIVGLFLEWNDLELNKALKFLQAARARRNPMMVEKLNSLGIDITLDEVVSFSGGGQVGRPHFARAMVARGLVKNRQEAFDKYLSAGRPAYVPKQKLGPEKALSVLRGAGAVSILAHPGLLKLPPARLEPLLREFMKFGLLGIEAHYSEHTSGTTYRIQDLARRLGLLVSGGSDFHGKAKPDISLGTGFGELMVPAVLLPPIRQKARELAKARQK